MDPIRMHLKNFTAFADAEIDFDAVSLAALVGRNGAGKSSLIDALCFALFGESTKGGARNLDNHVRRGETECRVTLEFTVGGQPYRIIRHRTLGKKSMLELYHGEELHVATTGDDDGQHDFNWVPISAKKIDDTQAMIEQLIRMDYRTFTASSLILQGESDSLTANMTDQERKEVLARILGLDLWDKLQESAREKARGARVEVGVIQRQIDAADQQAGKVQQLEGEIFAAEDELSEATEQLTQQTIKVTGLEAQLAQRPVLEQQLRSVDEQLTNLANEGRRLETDVASTEQELAGLEPIINRPDSLEQQVPQASAAVTAAEGALGEVSTRHGQLQEAYTKAEAAAQDVDSLDRQIVARQGQLKEIANDGARIRAELDECRATVARATDIRTADHLRRQCEVRLQGLDASEQAFRATDQAIRAAERRQAEWEREHSATVARIEADIAAYKRQTGALDGAPCGDDLRPLCPLLTGALTAKGALEEAGRQLVTVRSQESPHTAQLMTLKETAATLNYDPDAHTAVRRQINEVARDAVLLPALERAEQRLPELESQRADLEQRYRAVQRELSELNARRTELATAVESRYLVGKQLEVVRADLAQAQEIERAARERLARLQQAIQEARVQAEAAERRRPELQVRLKGLTARRFELTDSANRLNLERFKLEEQKRQLNHVQSRLIDERATLNTLRATEAKLREDIGRLRQSLEVAQAAAAEVTRLREQLSTAERQVLVYEVLDQACGKKAGVPALIVEAAVPQIEAIANELLGRMSDGRFMVRLDTQAETGAGTMREVLRITVLDGGVEAPYQTASGAERFMVDLSLRIALSKFLAHRAGAQIGLLVLDEGIGCTDPVNRGAVVAAITEASREFNKTLVVSHLQEVQDAFPQRIEVIKGPNGSSVKTVA